MMNKSYVKGLYIPDIFFSSLSVLCSSGFADRFDNCLCRIFFCRMDRILRLENTDLRISLGSLKMEAFQEWCLTGLENIYVL